MTTNITEVYYKLVFCIINYNHSAHVYLKNKRTSKNKKDKSMFYLKLTTFKTFYNDAACLVEDMSSLSVVGQLTVTVGHSLSATILSN